MNCLGRFLLVLSFLTRLGPARQAEPEDLAGCLPFLPLVGLVLGLALCLPFGLGLFAGKPWIQAWLAAGLSLLLTRGLHLDGLADVADGVTAHANPARFWEVVKDSHCGAFGVMALVLALLGQVVVLESLFAAGRPWSAAWVFCAGRCAAVGLGYATRELARPGLGALFLAGATLENTLAAVASTVLAGVVLAPSWGLAAALVLPPLALYPLYRLARLVDGVNGDFLGAAVVLGEISAGLGLILAL